MMFDSLPEDKQDIEFRFLDDRTNRDVVIGSLGGLALGGILSGGALVPTLLATGGGAGLGYLISKT